MVCELQVLQTHPSRYLMTKGPNMQQEYNSVYFDPAHRISTNML